MRQWLYQDNNKGDNMNYRYVFKKDLDAVYNVKGSILKDDGRISIIKTGELYTVWNAEEGYIFIHTFYEDEALSTFEKYSKVEHKEGA